jgi:hypothetical protein
MNMMIFDLNMCEKDEKVFHLILFSFFSTLNVLCIYGVRMEKMRMKRRYPHKSEDVFLLKREGKIVEEILIIEVFSRALGFP